MDNDISRWILEFLLRQSVDDWVLDALVRVLPLPNDDSSFQKSMLLRRMQSEIAGGSVSERILGLMEQIEELHYRDGVMVPESLKAAYCAVAVNCTVRFLEGDGDNKEAKYFEAVKRIWKGRVCKMERSEMAGLVSEELRCWGDEIEAAIWDSSVWKNLLLRSKENDASELVRVYVAEAWENLGPSFLELMADSLSDNTVREVLGLSRNGVCDPVIESAPSFSNPAQDAAAINNNKVITKKNGPPRRKHVASRRFGGTIAGTSRGVRITDNEELGVGTSDKFKILQSPEINKIQEALKSSTMELKAVVKDPLPDALNVADTVVSDIARENVNVDAPNSSVDKRDDAVRADEGNNGSGGRKNLKSRPNQSLMEPNGTARTYEWDDSIGDLPEEGSPSERNRLQLPTPKKRAVSPLKKYEITKLSRRRKFKKWSTLEEDTLRTGVQKYGKGNWKLILNMYRNIFEERTEVDLKDKWRNMVRY